MTEEEPFADDFLDDDNIFEEDFDVEEDAPVIETKVEEEKKPIMEEPKPKIEVKEVKPKPIQSPNNEELKSKNEEIKELRKVNQNLKEQIVKLSHDLDKLLKVKGIRLRKKKRSCRKSRINTVEVNNLYKKIETYKRRNKSLQKQLKSGSFHMIKRYENRLKERERDREALISENKSLKNIQRQQSKRLTKVDNVNDRVVQSLYSENQMYFRQIKKLRENQEKQRETIRRLNKKIILVDKKNLEYDNILKKRNCSIDTVKRYETLQLDHQKVKGDNIELLKKLQILKKSNDTFQKMVFVAQKTIKGLKKECEVHRLNSNPTSSNPSSNTTFATEYQPSRNRNNEISSGSISSSTNSPSPEIRNRTKRSTKKTNTTKTRRKSQKMKRSGSNGKKKRRKRSSSERNKDRKKNSSNINNDHGGNVVSIQPTIEPARSQNKPVETTSTTTKVSRTNTNEMNPKEKVVPEPEEEEMDVIPSNLSPIKKDESLKKNTDDTNNTSSKNEGEEDSMGFDEGFEDDFMDEEFEDADDEKEDEGAKKDVSKGEEEIFITNQNNQPISENKTEEKQKEDKNENNNNTPITTETTTTENKNVEEESKNVNNNDDDDNMSGIFDSDDEGQKDGEGEESEDMFKPSFF